MHNSNCSVFYENLSVKEVAPLYDMLPSRYSPIGEEMYCGPIDLPSPAIQRLKLWDDVVVKGKLFWEKVEKDRAFSDNFRKIAGENLGAIERIIGIRARIKNS